MAKTHSTVQIRNPTSSQHLVKLRPGQDMFLSFDKEIYGDVKIELASDYLEAEADGNHKYRIWQTKDVDGWGDYSSVFLGEIWIDYDKSIAKISAVLDCVNNEKLDHVTVINPDCFDVRVRPHQVIEFIVYDLEFSSLDEWNCSWNPTKDIHLEQIGYDYLSLQAWRQYYHHGDDDPGYRYAKFPRTEIEPSLTQWTRQHHFWFRFDRSVLDYADVGVNHIGNFVIDGISDRFAKQAKHTQYHLSLYLDTKKFERGRVLHTLGLKKKNDSHYTYAQQGMPRPIVYVPRVIKEKTLPVSREVGISNLQPASLDEGCKVISAAQSLEPVETDYDEYDENFYGCQQKDSWRKSRSCLPYHKLRVD